MRHVNPNVIGEQMVTAVYAEPFCPREPKVRPFKKGVTIAEIVATMDCLPAGFDRRGVVFINGEEIDRRYWHLVKPKPTTDEFPVAVTFHIALQGGGGGEGGGGGKQVIALVAALALTVVTAGIGAGFGGAVGIGNGWLAVGSLSAKVLAGAVGLVGALAIGALSAPPSLKSGEAERSSVDDNRSASASGNDVLRPSGTLDRVVGTTKVFPKYAGEPVNALVGDTQDEEIEAVVVLDGPHNLDDIRANGEPLEASEDVQLQIREGWKDDAVIDLITRYGRRTGSQIELSRHQVQSDNGDRLLNQTIPANSIPKWHGIPTKKGADEVWFRFAAAGLRFNSNDNQLAVPFRPQIRLRGTSTWIDLPEFHLSHSTSNSYKFDVKLIWDGDEPETVAGVPTKGGIVAAYRATQAQTVDPPGSAWTAHSYFDGGSGDEGLYSGSEGSTRLRHTHLFPNRIEFYLDSGTFPKGLYDVRFKRGHAYSKSSFSYSAYTLSSTVRDLFGYYLDAGRAIIAQTRENIGDQIMFQWATSIWNDPILPNPGYAAIAVKARNKTLDSISCVASGYVRDYTTYRVPEAAPTEIEPLGISESLDYATVRDQDVAFECQVMLPSDPTPLSLLWEAGRNETTAGARGSSIYVDASGENLIFRAGVGDSAITATTSDTIVKSVPISTLPFNGAVHTVAWDIRLSPGRIRLWIDGREIVNESIAGDITDWASFDTAVGYLTRDSYVGGISGDGSLAVDWPSSGASDLRMYTQSLMEDDAGWNLWVYGSEGGKIAAHYRDILCGDLNPDPLPIDLFDEDEILDWREDCASLGYTCNQVFSQQSIDDIISLIASCGYARPYRSEIWGVIRDRDRSQDPVVQVFSPRVARGITLTKAFAKLPDGFIVNFRNRESDYEEDEVIVYREGYEGGPEGDLETVTYGGLDYSPDVIARAEFDLKQAELRSSFYKWEAPANGLASRRGSLVALEHDILSMHTGRGRIKDITIEGGLITKIEIDSKVDIVNEPDFFDVTDIFAVDDIFEIGIRTAVVITRTTGVSTTHLTLDSTSGESTEIVFNPPLEDFYTPGSVFDVLEGNDEIPEVAPGCHVIVGRHRQEYVRLIVHEMRPKTDLTIDFIAVDEAPELWPPDANADGGAQIVITATAAGRVIKYDTGTATIEIFTTSGSEEAKLASGEGTIEVTSAADARVIKHDDDTVTVVVTSAAAARVIKRGSDSVSIDVTSSGYGHVIKYASGSATITLVADSASEEAKLASGSAAIAVTASGVGRVIRYDAGSASIAVTTEALAGLVRHDSAEVDIAMSSSGAARIVRHGAANVTIEITGEAEGLNLSLNEGEGTIEITASAAGRVIRYDSGSGQVVITSEGAGRKIAHASGSATIVVGSIDLGGRSFDASFDASFG